MPLLGLALILYGGGNGLHTITRGAQPLLIFGPRPYSLFLGQIALASLLVQAGVAIVALAFCLVLAATIPSVE